MNNLGTRFKEARKSLNIRQTDLEKKLNIKQSDISYIETGKAKKINIKYLHFLLSNGISWKWLFEGRGEMKLDYHESNNEILNISEEPQTSYLIEDKPGLKEQLIAANSKINTLEGFIKECIEKILNKIDINIKE